jgi:hypothetical protein
MLRLFYVVVLACALPVVPLGCVQSTVVAPPPARARVVEYCHQTIQSQAADHFGGRVGVRFDSPETFFVSNALEGVRGGALVAGRGTRERIQYACSVNIRSGRVVHARFRLVGPVGHSSDWSVDACQQRIRDEVAADHPRRTSVNFDVAETFFASIDEEGVRGRAKVETGDRRKAIRYECTVDVRRGRVHRARYHALEKPPLDDAGAVELCQQAVADQATREHGGRARVDFDSGSASSVSKSEKRVRGKAKLKAGRDREAIAYECSVNVRRERVTSTHFDSLEKHASSKEQLVETCQMVTREMVAADHGRRAAVEFATGEVFDASKGKRGVRGRGVLEVRGDRDPIRYECTLNRGRGKVMEARYRPIERPAKVAQQTVELCHRAVIVKVSVDRGRRTKVEFEAADSYFVSQSEEGVRGQGTVRTGFRGRGRDPILYDCRVNIRRGLVTETRLRYR